MEHGSGARIPPVRLAKDKFMDQIIVVTGAAQGIGKTTAEVFLKQGATVILVDIQGDALEAFEAEVNHINNKVAHRVCDIADEEQIDKTFGSIIAEYIRIDVLAHIAGIYPFHTIMGYPTDMYRRTMTVNVDATFFLIRTVLPHMQSKGYGRIILTSSGTFQAPQVGLSAYVASKSAVIGLVRAASIESGPSVTVDTVMPGLIKTLTVWNAGVQDDGNYPLFERVMATQVVKRCGLPEDIAHAVCFRASPEASFITWQILDVGGGASFH